MRENVEEREASAVFAEAAQLARHIRRAGEDIEVGTLLLPAKTLLGPGELAILAAQGVTTANVHKRPRVAILSTGDELVPLGQTPKPGQIINSNNITLAAQVRQAGAIPVNAGIVPDTMKDTVRALRSLADYDILLTSGGVSVGDFDFVIDAYDSVGIANHFWKVAVKPGKPLAFGVRENGQLVLGLPGNPASSLVSFELFVRPLLRKLLGYANPLRPRVPVTLSEAISKKPGRTHLVRATLERQDTGLLATPLAKQGSGMHRSMACVDCFLELPLDAGDFAAGSTVNALVLGEAL
ncbi:MAG: molybdopterin molybdotransferase MoeA [Kofleriaceae bacterium]|nr:molybdopterin molybdotransferase MoeA [Kofleriaceae bacterium]